MNESDSYNSYKLESLFGTNIDRLKFNEARDTLKIELNSFICKQKNIQVNNNESTNLWHKYEILTQQYSKELCEQIRLILEPTKCSKLKGDYKTGKGLNMRRVMELLQNILRIKFGCVAQSQVNEIIKFYWQ